MKKIFSISIIAFSIFLGMIIIGRFSTSKEKNNAEALSYKVVTEDKKTKDDKGRFIESLEDIKPTKQDIPTDNTGSLTIQTDGNITNQIANQIAQKMIGGAKDPDALIKDLKSGDPESVGDVYAITGQIINEKSKEINPENLKPKVDFNQLNLITDNSKTAKEKYFSDLDYVLNSEIKTNKTGDLSAKTLNDTYLNIDSVIKDLKNLRTPSDLAQFHSEVISVLGGIKNSISQLITINSDPAKLLIILSSMEKLNKEFQELFKGASKLI